MKALLLSTWFELRQYLRAISTWVFFGLFGGLSCLFMALVGGAFGGASAGVGGGDGNVHINSPHTVAALICTLGLFAIFVVTAIAGSAGYRDFGANAHPFIFTTRTSKLGYILPKYIAALTTSMLVTFSIPLGLFLATLLPSIDADRVGPQMISAYVAPMLVFILPNVAFTSAIFLTLALLTRQRLPHFVGGVILVFGYLGASVLSAELDNQALVAMLDPFGLTAFSEATEYWTTIERNTQVVWFEGLVAKNRLLWIGISVLMASVGSLLFRFRHEAFERKARKAGRPTPLAPPAMVRAVRLDLPKATRTSGLGTALLQLMRQFRRSFKDVVAHLPFVVILLAGMLFMAIVAPSVGKIYGTETWPVTYMVIEVLGGTFALFVVIIITLYAGELVWQERDLKVQQLVDATPVPNWVPMAGKALALFSVVLILLSMLVWSGIALQFSRGYTNFEIAQYVRSVFGAQLLNYTLLCVLALVVHSVVNHKYVGHFLLVLVFVGSDFLPTMGLEHGLWNYGYSGGRTYSDMNILAPFAERTLWYKGYWTLIACLLAAATNVFWVRGQEEQLGFRLKLAKLRMTRPLLTGTLAVGLLALAVGSYIVYNTNVLNEFQTSDDQEELTVRYEKEYKQYEGLAQPRITAVSVQADIFPAEADLLITASYDMLNKSDEEISDLHVQMPSGVEIRKFKFSRPTELTKEDKPLGYYIHTLSEPLLPGQQLGLEFELFFETKGFSNSGAETNVVANGSFVNSGIMPSFGYDPRAELSQKSLRKKHELPPKERMADLDDPEGRKNHYLNIDSDYVDFEAVVSTSLDQIAIAPGYLQKEWTEGDRRFFKYEMDHPIINFYSFLSARYEVKRDKWNDVDIEVYYHPTHQYNLDRMIQAVKDSLDYYTENFSPYQHRQVRIIEFPRYAAFAQSFPNTIPFSEAIGFIANVGEDDIDYPYYVTAHEVAHQWWAHQVIGANVQGSTVMSETLSQYSALMVMEKEFGRENIGKFLEYELDNYLSGRAVESKKELPLMRCENQQYIHYNKGSLVMYALKDYIGEKELNRALADYIADVGHQQPPYTTAREFVSYIRGVTPKKYEYLIADLFEHITLYENKATEATFVKLEDKTYEVTVSYESKKLRAGEQGEETEVELADWIDFGAYNADDETIYLEKHLVNANEGTVTFVVDERPDRAGIDPYHKLIDRHPDDNTTKVTVGSKS